jgi:hypothetical protein
MLRGASRTTYSAQESRRVSNTLQSKKLILFSPACLHTNSYSCSGSNIVLVSVLHSPEALGLEDIKRNEKIQSLDLTQHVPGYNHTSAIRDMEGIRTWILSACERAGRGVQVFIDAIDILAEDYGTASGAIKLVKDVVKCLSGLKG